MQSGLITYRNEIKPIDLSLSVLLRLLLTLFLVNLILTPWCSAATLELNHGFSHQSLFHEVEYFEDPSNQMAFSDIRQQAFTQLPSNQQGNIAFGYSKSAYWLKLNVVNHGNNDRWLLEVGYPLLDQVDFYWVDGQERVEKFASGDQLLFSQRPLNHRNFVLPIQLENKQKITIFIKVASSSSVRAPLTFWAQHDFNQNDQTRLLGQGVYFGILVVMLLYNLFIFFSIKEKAYFYYVIYVLSYFVLQGAINGFLYQFVLSDYPDIHRNMVALSLSLVIWFGCRFSVKFLNLRQSHRVGYRIINLVGWLGGLNFFTSFFLPYSLTIQILLLLAGAGSLFITYFGLLLWLKRGVREARFFSIAWGGFLLGSFLIVLNRMHLIPDNFVTENAAQLGSSIEVMLLSFALADKFSQLKTEKERVVDDAKKTLVQVNQLLNETLKRLEYSNKIKSEFLSVVSHELRTPMNGIVGANELLSTEILSDDGKNYLNISITSSKKMMKLIDSILEFVDLQSGLSKIKRERIDLDCLFADISSFAEAKLSGDKIAFTAKIRGSAKFQLHSDYEKILAILELIVDNAIKYTEYGTIELEVRVLGERVLADVEFSITDTGIGIDELYLNEVFDVFRQVDGTSKRSYNGLGMGLTTAQLLANMLGGKVHVDSKLGHGCQFVLTLPLYHLS